MFQNVRENHPKGQSRMDNPEKLATVGTQDTERRQIKHKNTTQKAKKMSNTDIPKTGSDLMCSRRISSS
jgi:hypothetical protein